MINPTSAANYLPVNKGDFTHPNSKKELTTQQLLCCKAINPQVENGEECQKVLAAFQRLFLPSESAAITCSVFPVKTVSEK
jgi:hypothetical protein